MSTPDRFARAIALIDAAHAADPSLSVVDGQPIPNELLYAHRMTAWLEKLAPDASENLRLAARAQHIRRWEIPRSTYPMTRAGYHQWRTRLYQFHADTAAQLLRQAGYDEPAIARVSSLLRKEGIKSDPDMQLLEDVICLVFLENYFADFARTKDQAKLLPILQKTWKKMSPRGHQAVLSIELPPETQSLVRRALA